MPAHFIKSICVFLTLATVAGCASPAWYGQAMSGHLEMMRQREEVAVILRKEDTDPELVAKLQTAQQARQFGIEELGLPDSGSYTQYVHTGRSAATWNVVTAPEFSVQARKWCFPVAGCVPYRGYFNQQKAERFATKMSSRGYDVSISPASAYSTLGWFDDPLLDTMLHYSDAQLAATIFHEMAHQELYVRGDAAFSESFAMFVEEQGLQAWLRSRGDHQDMERWRSNQQAAARFSAFLATERSKLEQLYEEKLPDVEMRARKQQVLSGMIERYQGIVASEWHGRDHFSGWFDQELNNARLALASTYRGNRCAFRRLFQEAGGDLGEFMQLASQKATLPAAERARWLQQDCHGIASTDDL